MERHWSFGARGTTYLQERWLLLPDDSQRRDRPKSLSINGTVEAYQRSLQANPANPILTNANTTSYFQAVGHADLFQDANGRWWACALAMRIGPDKSCPMGRETFLVPVTWNKGLWPEFANVSGHMNGWSLPLAGLVSKGEGSLVNAPDHIKFAPNSLLPPHLVHWRLPLQGNYAISPRNHPYSLRLKSSASNLSGHNRSFIGPQNQTFLARRQTHTLFTYSVNIDASSLRAEGQEIGVSAFLDQVRNLIHDINRHRLAKADHLK